MPESPIVVETVSKKYCKSLKRSMLYGLADMGRNFIGLSANSGKLRRDEFWAVRDLSFEVPKGTTLGLIGPNGCGKTTVLKMLNGIFWPDVGKITTRGRVGALIAVGSGFHPLLTGRENIFVNGAILGMNLREMKKKFDAIVDFAGIGDFIDTPVKYYSSGMFVRLGFSVAIFCEPEILLIDEVLSVGDANFNFKCIQKMKELDQRGITKVFVSHDLNAVLLLCSHALYLRPDGSAMHGQPRTVINEYRKDVFRRTEESVAAVETLRFGTKEIVIENVEFVDRDGHAKILFSRGEWFQVRISFAAFKTISDPEFSVGFFTQAGVELSKTTTRDHGFHVDTVSGKGTVTYTIAGLPFNVGRYLLTIGSWDSTGHIAYDHHEKLYEIMIEDGLIDGRIHERFGLVHIPATWAIHNNESALARPV